MANNELENLLRDIAKMEAEAIKLYDKLYAFDLDTKSNTKTERAVARLARIKLNNTIESLKTFKRTIKAHGFKATQEFATCPGPFDAYKSDKQINGPISACNRLDKEWFFFDAFQQSGASIDEWMELVLQYYVAPHSQFEYAGDEVFAVEAESLFRVIEERYGVEVKPR